MESGEGGAGEVAEERRFRRLNRARRVAGSRAPTGQAWLVRACTRSTRSRSGWMARQTSRRLMLLAGRARLAPPGPRCTVINPALANRPESRRTTIGLMPMLQARRALVDCSVGPRATNVRMCKETANRVAIMAATQPYAWG